MAVPAGEPPPARRPFCLGQLTFQLGDAFLGVVLVHQANDPTPQAAAAGNRRRPPSIGFCPTTRYDLRTAQTLLRSANLQTTAIYVQVADGKRVEAIDRLDPFG
jgi:hypothetical protein